MNDAHMFFVCCCTLYIYLYIYRRVIVGRAMIVPPIEIKRGALNSASHTYNDHHHRPASEFAKCCCCSGIISTHLFAAAPKQIFNIDSLGSKRTVDGSPGGQAYRTLVVYIYILNAFRITIIYVHIQQQKLAVWLRFAWFACVQQQQYIFASRFM